MEHVNYILIECVDRSGESQEATGGKKDLEIALKNEGKIAIRRCPAQPFRQNEVRSPKTEIEPRFVRKSCAGQVEIAILPQFFWAIELRFTRKGCNSYSLVATAPARNRKEGESKRARRQEGNRRRCEDVRM